MIFSVKRFTEEDFINADKIERLYMSVVQPIDFELTQPEKAYLELLTKVYPIVISRAEDEAILVIENLERGKWRSQVEKIYKDSKRLFDPMNAANAMIANIARQKRIAIAEKLESIAANNDDDKIIVAALSAADRVWSSFDEKPKSKSKKDKHPIQNTQTLPPLKMPQLPMHELYDEAKRKTEIMANVNAED